MRHVYMWRFKKANVFKGKKIFSLCQGAFYKNLKTFIKQLSTFVYETLKAVKIGSSVFSGNSNHGKRRNAPLCGTEMAEEGVFTYFSRLSPHSKASVHGKWTYVSEVSYGLFRAAFSVPRMRASVFSVVKKRSRNSH